MSLKNKLLPENCVKILDQVGAGAYGQVSRCLIKNDPSYKIVKRNYIDHSVDFIGSIRELDVFAKISHPYVVSSELLSTGTIDNETSTIKLFKPDKIYFIMDLGAYDCHNMIYSRRASFNVLKEAMVHILLGVTHIHDLGYTHADIKPRNCIWFRKNGKRYMKIADFGLSRPLFKNLPKPLETMTPAYRAPEIALENPFYDGEKIDSWGVGCTFFEMISGAAYITTRSGSNKTIRRWLNSAPNNSSEMMKKCFHNRAKKILFDEALGEFKRKEFIDLLSKLLEKDPEYRYTPRQALEHPFFSEDKELISSTLELSETLEIPPIFVKRNFQRNDFCQYLKFLFQTNKDAYDSQYIFHALRIYDIVVEKMEKLKELPEIEIEWRIIKYVCVYISRKFFDEKNTYSMIDFTLSHSFYDKNYHLMDGMEMYILNDLLEYRFYNPSLFEGVFDEYKDARVSHKNILTAFNLYESLETGSYDLTELSARVYEKLPSKKIPSPVLPHKLEECAPITPLMKNYKKSNRAFFTTRNDNIAAVGEYTGRKRK